MITLCRPAAGVVPLLPGVRWMQFRQAQGPELAEGPVIIAALERFTLDRSVVDSILSSRSTVAEGRIEKRVPEKGSRTDPMATSSERKLSPENTLRRRRFLPKFSDSFPTRFLQ